MDNPTWTPRNTFSKILPYVFLNKNSHICEPGDPATDGMDSGYCSRAGVMERAWARGKTKKITCLSAQSFPVVGTHFLASFHASIQHINDSFMVLDSDSLRNALFATIPHESQGIVAMLRNCGCQTSDTELTWLGV